jgi:hypothetical protein
MNLFDRFINRGVRKRERTLDAKRNALGNSLPSRENAAFRGTRDSNKPSRLGRVSQYSRDRKRFQLDSVEGSDDSPVELEEDRGVPTTLTHHGKPLLDAAKSGRTLERKRHKPDLTLDSFDALPDDRSDSSGDVGGAVDLLAATETNDSGGDSETSRSKPRFRDLMENWALQRERVKKERQLERLLHEQQTERLDAVFRELSDQLVRRKSTNKNDAANADAHPTVPVATLDEYDLMLQQLAEEPRSKPAEPESIKETRRQERALGLLAAKELTNDTFSVESTPMSQKLLSEDANGTPLLPMDPDSLSSDADPDESHSDSLAQHAAGADAHSALAHQLHALEQLWQQMPPIRENPALDTCLAKIDEEAARFLGGRWRPRSASPAKASLPGLVSVGAGNAASDMEISDHGSHVAATLGQWALRQLRRLEELLRIAPDQWMHWTCEEAGWRRLWSAALVMQALCRLFPKQQSRHPVTAPLALLLSEFFGSMTLALDAQTGSHPVTAEMPPSTWRSLALLIVLAHLWIDGLVLASGRLHPDAYAFLRALLDLLRLFRQSTKSFADRHGLIENSVTRDTSASEALDHLYQCAVPASTAVVDPALLSLATGTLCEQLEQNAQMQRYLQLPLGVALQSSLRELFLVMDTDLPPWCKRYTAALQKAERSLPTAPRHRYRANEPKLLNPRLDMDRAGRSSSQQTDEDKKLRQQFRRELRATGRVLRRRQEVFAAQRLQAEHSRRVQLQRRARQATGLIGSEQLR